MLKFAWIIQMVLTGGLALVCFNTGSNYLGFINAGLCAIGLVGFITSAALLS